MTFIDRPTHWRKWAVKTRAWASNTGDVQARAMLIEIAVKYEELAELAQQRMLTASPNES
jgi:hypothetical protein